MSWLKCFPTVSSLRLRVYRLLSLSDDRISLTCLVVIFVDSLFCSYCDYVVFYIVCHYSVRPSGILHCVTVACACARPSELCVMCLRVHVFLRLCVCVFACYRCSCFDRN